MLRFILKLLSFVRGHKWKDEVGVRVSDGCIYTTLICERCAHSEEYPTLDREAFGRVWRMRGCEGRKQPHA